VNAKNGTNRGGPSLNISDILYILLRHKWKIVLFTLLGFAGAAVVWVTQKPMFQSRSKIYVKYVSERRTSTAGPGEAEVVREPETRGNAVVNAEIEILTSTDCVLEAVKAIGAQRVLAAYGGGTNEYQAAGILLRELTATPGASGVVTVLLGHADPDIAREALTRIIEAYRRKHVRVHRATQAYDDLQAEADRIRVRLTQTEEQLRGEKTKANVVSLDQAKEDISIQLSSLRTSIFATEAELAERHAELEIAQKRFGTPLAVTNAPASTNLAAGGEYPSEKVEAYSSLAAKLDSLQKRESDLLLGPFSETSRYIVQVREQIADTQKKIAELGIDPAKLGNLNRQVGSAAPANPLFDIDTLRARTLVLEARVNELRRQRGEIEDQSKRIDASEDTIRQLELRKEMEEKKLRQYESNLDKARVDQAIDSTKLTNIYVVQEPTPAARDMLKIYKLLGGVLFGMIGAGIALAFAMELVFDTSLKRSKDVEGKTGVPLFVTIPQFGANGRPRLKLSRKALKKSGLSDETGLVRKGEIAPWEPSDPMFEYYESLRDRVVMSYEGDPRKPKLVAVTSCNKGAGTTRVSTGLAAALSRDVQRRVLYIGLEKNKVAVTAFYKGQPDSKYIPELEATANGEGLEPELFSLARTAYNPQGASIVQSFSDMIPKLRMSAYDYVIFDLPPISETSGSLRLAGQMERTLLVVESEQTQRAKVERVRDLLSETGTRMFAVLNKTKSYGPRLLTE
jgi:polysaccharide biosynthesis transport protein